MHRLNFIANHSNPKNTHNMKTRIILLTLALSVCSIWAADITGVWKAQFDTQRGLQTAKRAFRIQRAYPGKKRADFDRHVRARDRAEVIGFQKRVRRPLGNGLW